MNIVLDTNCQLTSLSRRSAYYSVWRDFFFRQAIEQIYALVYFAVGLGNLLRELLAVVAFPGGGRSALYGFVTL